MFYKASIGQHDDKIWRIYPQKILYVRFPATEIFIFRSTAPKFARGRKLARLHTAALFKGSNYA
jgi:hypothetical protein